MKPILKNFISHTEISIDEGFSNQKKSSMYYIQEVLITESMLSVGFIIYVLHNNLRHIQLIQNN